MKMPHVKLAPLPLRNVKVEGAAALSAGSALGIGTLRYGPSPFALNGVPPFWPTENTAERP